eukprot:TRINITY_DN4212_c0_g1_i1.p1 TRINITY_DN4212_c0_g1~~TRINITY_DN4212_c0_g1_i1.p1  ORF type:complete len:3722 (-),score=960.49 TRINITY_DN4212_c0_g1_i1:1518-12683(-)
MFNVQTDLCTESCQRVAFNDKSDASGTCNTTAMCMWIGDVGCTTSCQSSYTDQASCDYNDYCQWDRLRRSCGVRCTLSTSSDTCVSNSMCEWKQASSTCEVTCSYRHNNMAACNVDAQCAWDSVSAQCKSKCTYSSASTCQTDTTCNWIANSTSCAPKCEATCFSEQCCQNTDGCMYDRSTGGCKTTCDDLTPQKCALEVGMCGYNTITGSCEDLCSVKYNGTGSSMACGTDVKCMYDSTLQSCRQTCSYFSSQLSCITSTNCKWDSNTNLCSKRCNQLNSTTCPMDSTCDYVASRVGAKCLSKCVYRYSQPDACRSDSECMWDVTESQCTNKCGRLSEGQCYQQTMCEYDRLQVIPCVQTCQYRHSTAGTCDPDTQCLWDSATSVCLKQCNFYSTTSSCTLNSMCQWTNNMCQRRCQYRHNSSSTACSSDSNCQWNIYTSSCENSCDKLNTNSSCADNALCNWEGGSCKKSCTSITSSGICIADDRCMWDVTSGSCKTTCTRLSLSSTCMSEAMCSWDGGNCNSLCKFAHNDKDSCNSDSRCLWENGNCAPTCGDTATDSTCNARSMCNWDTNLNSCIVKCTSRTEGQCGSDTSCAWNGVRCGSKCVSSYTTEGACDADANCMWDSGLILCKDTCSVHPTSGECSNDRMCMWNKNSGTCKKTCTYAYSSSTSCDASGECSFSTAQDRCYPACTGASDVTSCKANPICRWSDSNSSCVAGCSTYTTAGTCPTASCDWDATNSKCSPNCNDLANKAACSTDSNCDWSGFCQVPCEQAHTTKDGCSADGRCVWDMSTSTCKKACNSRAANDCTSEPNLCSYNPTTDSCSESCVKKYTSTTASCNADTSCAYDPVRNACTSSCESEGTAESCATKSMCEWNSAASTCKRRCADKLSLDDCRADAECLVTADSKCTNKCVFKYTSMATCSLDSACMWSVADSQCRETCSYNTDGSVCLGDKMCEFTTTCNQKCNFRHNNENNCTMDTECVWDSSRAQCGTSCLLLEGSVECQNQPACFHDGTTCKPRCTRLEDSSACGAAPAGDGCAWNVNASTCGNTCDQLTYDQCQDNTLCLPQSAPNGNIASGSGDKYICKATCNLKHSEKPSCDGDDTCKWDAVSNMCRENCNVTQSMTDCKDSAICQWSDSTATCNSQCAFVGENCETRTDCKQSSTGKCVVTCNNRDTEQNCKGDTSCIWDNSTATCSQTCAGVTSSITCGKNLNCIWDSSASSCIPQCALKYTTEVSCKADSKCMWDVTTQICKTTCSFTTVKNSDPVSIVSCNSDSMCEVSSSNCAVRCEYRATTSTACSGYSDCQWNPSASKCTAACSALNDAACTGSPMCQLRGTTCVKRCEYRYSAQSACDGDLECAYDAAAGKCSPTCSKLTDSARCDQSSMCNYGATTGQCTPTCLAKFVDGTNCNRDPTCQWDATNNQCIKKCVDVVSQIECTSQRDTCVWDAQYLKCTTRCDVKYNDTVAAVACSADTQCHYNDIKNTCMPSCVSQPTSAICLATAGCNWNPATQACKTACSMNTVQNECELDTTCQWNNGQCSLKCDLKYPSSPLACNTDRFCQYDSDSSTCTHKCNFVSDGTTCELTGLCSWDNTAKTCGASCTSKFVSSEGCKTDSTCQWNNNTQTCYTGCSSSTSVSGRGCTRNPTCMFDEAAASCTPECSAVADCSTNADCTVNSLGNCVYKCTAITDLTRCQELSACRVSGSSCIPACDENYNTQKSECTRDTQCMWNSEESRCGPSCTEVDAVDCRTMSSCMAVNGTCAKSCSQVYTNFIDCISDDNCIWDLESSVCKRTCNTYDSYANCNAQSDCNWVGRLSVCVKKCEAIRTQDCAGYDQCFVQTTATATICVEKCPYRHGARGECNSDPDCEWYSSSASCGARKCEATLTMSQCKNDASCNFNATANTCERKPCQWTDSDTCDSYSDCTWHIGNNTCIVKTCTPTNQATCGTEIVANSTCLWVDNTCTNPCSYWGTAKECIASACEWSFAGSCRKTCADLYNMDATSCNKDVDCIFDPSINKCTPACNKLFTSATCTVTDICVWGGSACRVNCPIAYNQEGSCDANVNCAYSTVDGCVANCNSLNATSCASDTFCRTDGESCKPGCALKYGNKPEDCVSDTTCMYSPISGCVARCETYPVGSCPIGCSIKDSTCTAPCDEIHLDYTSCSSDSNCRWASGKCSTGCGQFTVSTCPAECVATGGSCKPPCSERFFSQTSCDTDPACQWNYNAGSCAVKNCTGSSTAEADCPSAACYNGGSTCQPKCADYPQTAACAAVSYCSFDASTCHTSCNLLSPTDCTTNSLCLVTGSQCQAACNTAFSVTDCAKISTGCIWGDGGCRTSCKFKFPGAPTAACTADTQCIGMNGACEDKMCAYSDETSCIQDSRCQFTNGQCSPSSCTYGTQATCEAGNCKWSYTESGSTCGPSPCRGTDSTTCALKPQCQSANGACADKPCFTPVMSDCTLDPLCSWNETTENCQSATADCVVTAWNGWSDCNRPCSGGTQSRSRKVIRAALPGGQPCPVLTETRTCNDNVVCNCQQYAKAVCVLVDSCRWDGSCQSTGAGGGCADYTTQGSCPSGVCQWDPIVDVCTAVDTASRGFSTSATCTGTLVDRAIVEKDVNFMGSAPVAIFPQVNYNPAMGVIEAIMVTVERGYSAGTNDFILYNNMALKEVTTILNGSITVYPKLHQGVWIFRGFADISVYAQLLQQLQFYSRSRSNDDRVITWTIGYNTLYSTETKNLYYFNVSTEAEISWSSAKAACESSTMYGARGRLPGITTAGENNLFQWKMAKTGWIDASDDAVEGQWKWTTSQSSFWAGGSSALGGKAVNTMYSNWEPAGFSTNVGEPTNIPGNNFALFDYTGFWSTSPSRNPTVKSFFCEFGDNTNPIPGYVFGTATIHMAGCRHASVTDYCTAHTDSTSCMGSTECQWSGTACTIGCQSVSSSDDCTARAQCHLNIDAIPAVCEDNVCTGKAQAACDVTANNKCVFSGGSCGYNTKCNRFNNMKAACQSYETCGYDETSSTCNDVSACPKYLVNGTCDQALCQAQCRSDPSCLLNMNGDKGSCSSRACTQSTTSSACSASPQCEHVTTAGSVDIQYQPGTQPANVLPSLTVPTGTDSGFTVSIVSNYNAEDDQLVYTGPSDYMATFDRRLGLMTLYGRANASAFQSALNNVAFTTNNNDNKVRKLSWSQMRAGSTHGPVYFPEFNTIVEFVSSPQISRLAAAARCQAQVLNGVQGRLLRLVSTTMAASMMKSMSVTEKAWIGGQGSSTSDGPVWSFSNLVAGPDVFFRGTGLVGSTPTYSNFVSGEPSTVLEGSVRYVVLRPDGKWQTVSSTSSDSAGYFCEYPITNPTVSQAGVVSLGFFGCLNRPCSYTTADSCSLDPRCEYTVAGGCAATTCSTADSTDGCNQIAGCVFDAATQVCGKNTQDTCVGKASSDCTSTKNCGIVNGECGTVTCAKYADVDSCQNDAKCVAEDGACVAKLCGSNVKEQCLVNSQCTWDSSTSSCAPHACLQTTDKSTCESNPLCGYSAGSSVPCDVKMCRSTNELLCVADQQCAWNGAACTRNGCSLMTELQCSGDCSWNSNTSVCVRTTCSSTDRTICESVMKNSIAICQWSISGGVGGCAPKDVSSMTRSMAAASAADDAANCIPKVKDYTGLLVAMLLMVLALFAVLVFLIYRQRKVAEALAFQQLTSEYGVVGGGDHSELKEGMIQPPVAGTMRQESL